jgi:hypothetical protein
MSLVRASDGFGSYSRDNEEVAADVVMVFETGEIWAQQIQNHADNIVYLNELQLENGLRRFSDALAIDLECPRPHAWIAGFEGIAGKKMWVPRRQGYNRWEDTFGPAHANNIVRSGVFEDGGSPLETLKGFYEDVYDEFGITREAWFDDSRDR